MANRRMFSKELAESDAFLELSKEEKLLWFLLGLVADDDGFTNSVKRVAKTHDFTPEEIESLIESLIAKGFLFKFESGVVLIRHWKNNNQIQKDRYHETKFMREKAAVSLDEANVYQLVSSTDPACIRPVSKLDTQNSLVEESLDEVRSEEISSDEPRKDELTFREGEFEGEPLLGTRKASDYTGDCPKCHLPATIHPIDKDTFGVKCQRCGLFAYVISTGEMIRESAPPPRPRQ